MVIDTNIFENSVLKYQLYCSAIPRPCGIIKLLGTRGMQSPCEESIFLVKGNL